jgi:trigger factor
MSEATAENQAVKVLEIKDGGSCEKVLKVQVSSEMIEEQRTEVIESVRKEAIMPGFRKGKAPLKMLLSRFAGAIDSELQENVLQEAVKTAVIDSKINPINVPQVDNWNPDPEGNWNFDVKVEVKPEVDVKDYKGIPITASLQVVADQEIDNELDRLRERNAEIMIPDPPRPAKNGDMLTIDFDGSIDGEPIEGGKAENYTVEIGKSQMIPGFEEQLIGADTESEREIKVTFPADYHEESLKAKEAVFQVKVHEIKEKRLPEADDAFAALQGEFKTIDELRDAIKKQIETYRESQMMKQRKDEVAQWLVENNDFDIPQSIVDRYAEYFAEQREREFKMYKIDKKQIGKTDEEFAVDDMEMGRKSVRLDFILHAIGDKEKIKVTPEDVNAEILNLAATRNMTPEKYRAYLEEKDMLGNIEHKLQDEKIYDFLLENAEIKEPEEKPEEKKKPKKKTVKKTEKK